MPEANHTIKEHILDLAVPDEASAPELQEAMVTMMEERLLPVLNEVFNRFDKPGKQLVIDELELDLGQLHLQMDNDALDMQIREAVREQLEDQIFQRGREEDDESVKALEHWLKEGTLPWWGGEYQNLDVLLSDLMENSPQVLMDMLRDLGRGPRLAQVAKRLALQSTGPIVERLVTLFLPQNPTLVAHYKAWQDLVPKARKRNIRIGWLKAVLATTPTDLFTFLSAVVRHIGLLEDKSMEQVVAGAQGPLLRSPLKLSGKKLKLVLDLRKAIKAPEEPASETPLPEADQPAPREERFITNAGLVIMWPFLERLFGELGYVKNGEFVDEDAQHRAVASLDYLAFGETTRPEPGQVLNKLLCGIPLSDATAVETTLKDAERAEMDKLVEAAIGHWPALGKTSMAGFQQSFIQREGFLLPASEYWDLVVDRKTMDLLLDRLPWSIHTVALPWMPLPIYVEW